MELNYREAVARARAQLQDRNIQKVAEQTGIHFNTLYAIKNGRQDTPHIETLEKLLAYLGPERVTP